MSSLSHSRFFFAWSGLLTWEKQAPDIPGIPPADPNEGLGYAMLIASLKSSLPAGKSVSFASPASYWYLRSFPISLLAQSVDYVVYMTYDFHGTPALCFSFLLLFGGRDQTDDEI